MRFALILLTALLLASPKPSPKPQPPIATGDTGKAQADHRGTQNDPLVVHIEGTKASEQEAADNKKRADFDASIKRRELLLTVFIAVAAFVQAGAVVWQIVIYRKQSKIMHGSLSATQTAADAAQMSAKAAMQGVALQKAQLRQWVEVEDWNGRTSEFLPEKSRTGYFISFWITNPTQMPLTFTGVEVGVDGSQPYLHTNGRQKFLLGPKKRHHVEFPIVLVGENFHKLVKGELTYTITIDVGFDDAFGDAQTHHSLHSCTCSPQRCVIYTYENHHKE